MRKCETSKRGKFMVIQLTDATKLLPDRHFYYLYLDIPGTMTAPSRRISSCNFPSSNGGILGAHDYYLIPSAPLIFGTGIRLKCKDGSILLKAVKVKGAVDEFQNQQGGLMVTKQELSHCGKFKSHNENGQKTTRVSTRTQF